MWERREVGERKKETGGGGGYRGPPTDYSKQKMHNASESVLMCREHVHFFNSMFNFNVN